MCDQSSEDRKVRVAKEILQIIKEVECKIDQLPTEETAKCSPEEQKRIKSIVSEAKQDIKVICNLVGLL